MKASVKALVAVSALVGAGASVFMVSGVGAQGSYTPAAATVTVAGTVQTSLDARSIAALTAPVCTLGPPYRSTSLSTTSTAMPPSVLSTRNRVVVTNLDTAGTKEIWCCVNCTPSASQASALMSGMSKDYSARAVDAVNCRCSTATCSINVEEYTCS